MADTNKLQVGEWLIKQGSKGEIVVQHEDGSGVVIKSGSDDIVTHIFHWFLSDVMRAKAAQPEVVADSELPGMWESADFSGGETDCVPPASAHTDLHTEIEKLVARNDALLANENRLLDELLRIQDELLRAQASVGAADGFKARLVSELKKTVEMSPDGPRTQGMKHYAVGLLVRIERGEFDEK